MSIEILMPALSPTMEEGTIAKWLVSEGDTVKSGDILAEIETDKATMEFEAVDEGVIGKIVLPAGSEGVKVNSLIAILLEDGETEVAAPKAAAPKAEAAPTPAPVTAAAPVAAPVEKGERVFASPLARRIAADKGLDLNAIAGSGPHGRIVRADVENATAAPKAAAAAAPAPVAATPAASSTAAEQILKMYQGRDYTEIKLDGMRKTIAARLTEAKQTVPHFYLRRSVNLDALMAFRADLNAKLGPRGIKISVNDFVIKACATALQQVPKANAIFAGDRIVQMKASDVAIAVAVEGGLFTPVIRDADSKSISALSHEMKDLAKRARDKKLQPQDYQGGSFSISNLGMFGVENFDAVINPPQGAILAVGAGIKKPIVGEDGEITTATLMSLTLSVDHRVIDGALGAHLLTAIVENLENPLTMLA
ncbi:pyruvate dehydrogenase E2 component (dihydrolipoamide acetyltransferase) [Ketogulonicigenium robustum]|uniref:Acetyltransferase component of pyruvate dehydrogenase complex n=1 Tax=Ketogulonicigenium robustum TaxID=92947 RepID=A0A1W6NYG1_9RHOB|nr:pyruvate dehydrogenase complex dihydrolipoamide acetyltransferase [Ketogulonicigenium robustum]ARO14285.1 pyruvate dehydrogenase E2 component (dihydrolipoamide acetyltransferase) [Ketogulonicigenium robustum]